MFASYRRLGLAFSFSLETSYCTNKAFKTTEAYNRVVSVWVASVEGKVIVGNVVVVTNTRHLQEMNDPLVNIWIIAQKDGSIISAYFFGCKAGLVESYSHVASVMFYKSAQKITCPL